MALAILKAIAPVLTAVGLFWALYQAYNLASFIHLYFVRRSTLDRYKTTKNGEVAWALVTGATDGIGRGFAEELCRRGFNVILHGRNEQKLEAEKEKLLLRWPSAKIRLLKIDASKEAASPESFQRAANQMKDITLKVLINNVGGSSGMISFQPLQHRSSEDIRAYIDINIRFPVEITKALLPQLLQSSPALIMNIGSASSDFGIPYLSVYSGCKSYNKSWSSCLTSEMTAENTGIEVLHINVAAVATDYTPRQTSIFVPNAGQMAKGALNVVGCGRASVYGHWGHALQAGSFFAMPAWMANRAVIDIGKQERIRDDELLKNK